MPLDRLIAIYECLDRRSGEGNPEGSLCSVATEIVDLSGSGIMVFSSDASATTLCTSDRRARELLELETTLDEGPCTAAGRTGAVSDYPDLRDATDAPWVAYGAAAMALGASAVFAFPVHIGAVRFGALGFYRDRPGELSDLQRVDGYLLASVVGRAILAMQAGAGPDTLASELRSGATRDFAVHQAAGMVAVQGALSIKEALVVLRAHAFASEIGLSDLSAQVIARRVRYAKDSREWVADDGPRR